MTAWQDAGVSPDAATPLARLERLVRVRVDPALLDELAAADAHDLAGEARAIGDEDFATELEARSRANAYR